MARSVLRTAADAFQRRAAASAFQRGATASAFQQGATPAAVQRGTTVAAFQRGGTAAAVQRGATAATAWSAAAFQRRATAPRSATGLLAAAAFPLQANFPLLARRVGPLVPSARPYSTGKGRKKQKKICKYDGEKIAEEFAKSNARLEAADRERAEITKSVKSIEEKQSKKPWFTVNFRGRQMNIPGVASLAWRVGEAIAKIL